MIDCKGNGFREDKWNRVSCFSKLIITLDSREVACSTFGNIGDAGVFRWLCMCVGVSACEGTCECVRVCERVCVCECACVYLGILCFYPFVFCCCCWYYVYFVLQQYRTNDGGDTVSKSGTHNSLHAPTCENIVNS